MIDCIAVGAGGFIGAVCRYLIGMIPSKEGCVFFCIGDGRPDNSRKGIRGR